MRVLECALIGLGCVIKWWSRLSCLVATDKTRFFLNFYYQPLQNAAFSNEIKGGRQLYVISSYNKDKTLLRQQPLTNLPRRRQKISSTMSTFFLLLSTPLLLLLNVEVPPFLVSCAIAFSYMYFCIWKVPVSVQYPTPVVCHALKIRAPARSREVNLMLSFTKQLKCVQLKRIRLRPDVERTRAPDSRKKSLRRWKWMESPLPLIAAGSSTWSQWDLLCASTVALVISILLLLPPVLSGFPPAQPTSLYRRWVIASIAAWKTFSSWRRAARAHQSCSPLLVTHGMTGGL